MPMTDTIENEIVARLAESEPEVEVLLCERSGGTMRIFIDHPDGVSLDLCERVTHALRAIRENYALEVSSPGPKRPLVKPAHFERYVGRRAKVRTRGEHDGRRNFTGEIVSSGDAEVTLAVDEGLVSIAFDDIDRAHLAPA
jgi:ribosome maturation factor RimP